ncbi:glycosyltransferase family 21 protein [Lactarius sanguifluus]|nr:glycosyltransferase family 21 protein [Lactarius sanguifluus]
MISPIVDDYPKIQDWHHLLSACLSTVRLIWYAFIWSVGLLGCWTAQPAAATLSSVPDEHDKVLPVVYELLAKYPNVNARVIIGDVDVGTNPKVNNLIRSYNEATHDILWVLDSNVAVAPGTLARAVEILSHPSHPNAPWRRIALVHHMYVAINAAAVDSCVVGKSTFFRRSNLEHLDGSFVPQQQQHDSGQRRGLAAFSRFLAEDNMIGLSLWHELNLRHDLSCDVAHNTLGDKSLSDYVWRRVRWIQVRKHMSLAATLLEPFTESVMLSVVAAVSTQFLTGVTPHLFLLTHFILWILIDLDVYTSLAGHTLPSSKREVLAFPIWILAMMGDEVEWRGRRYKVMRNGEVARR